MSDEREAVLREVREMLAGLVPRTPRFRYFQARDGWMFCWTTERMRDDRGRFVFAAMVYRPVGAGARSGKAESWALQRTSYRAKRKDAKALARRWYEVHVAKRLSEP